MGNVLAARASNGTLKCTACWGVVANGVCTCCGAKVTPVRELNSMQMVVRAGIQYIVHGDRRAVDKLNKEERKKFNQLLNELKKYPEGTRGLIMMQMKEQAGL